MTCRTTVVQLVCTLESLGQIFLNDQCLVLTTRHLRFCLHWSGMQPGHRGFLISPGDSDAQASVRILRGRVSSAVGGYETAGPVVPSLMEAMTLASSAPTVTTAHREVELGQVRPPGGMRKLKNRKPPGSWARVFKVPQQPKPVPS